MDRNDLLKMFKLREDILAALEEGILAIDNEKRVIFINQSAISMLHISEKQPVGNLLSEIYPASKLANLLKTGEKEFNVQMKSLKNDYVISDSLNFFTEQSNEEENLIEIGNKLRKLLEIFTANECPTNDGVNSRVSKLREEYSIDSVICLIAYQRACFLFCHILFLRLSVDI